MVTAADVPAAQLDAAIKRATLDSVPASDLDPVVADALAVASEPLTPEQTALLKKCLSQRSCETGRGTLTIGINADFTNNPWWNIRRAEAVAQAIAYPQVKKIIFTSATSGEISEVLANLRSLIAQKVDVIVEDPVFGAAILPAAKQAKAAGIAFVTANSPLPAEAESSVAVQFPYDLCSMGTAAAAKIAAGVTTGEKTYALYTGVPGNAIASVWWPCVEKAMTGAGWKKVATGYTQWTAQGEAQAANGLLASGKNPSAILYDSSLDDFLSPYIKAGKPLPAAFTDTAWFSAYPIHDSAVAKGLKPVSYVSNGHVWYVRLAVSAGVMAKSGKTVSNKIMAPVPVVAFTDVPKIDGMPANVPIPTLLSPELVKLALAAQ
ncbi:hypothetical protein ASG91_19100 [Phycicoccus sp. Soil802]|nr:hypothetical protein ASG91_19100 [Phycicoccus sp. Soil802]